MDLLAIFIGAVIGLVPSMLLLLIKDKQDREIKIRELKKKKCEEAFISANISFTNYLKPFISWDNITYDGAKLNMIIRFYLPTLKDNNEKYIKALSDYSMRIMNDNIGVKLEDNKIKNTEELRDAFMNSYKTLSDSIVEESKKYDLI